MKLGHLAQARAVIDVKRLLQKAGRLPNVIITSKASIQSNSKTQRSDITIEKSTQPINIEKNVKEAIKGL